MKTRKFFKKQKLLKQIKQISDKRLEEDHHLQLKKMHLVHDLHPITLNHFQLWYHLRYEKDNSLFVGTLSETKRNL